MAILQPLCIQWHTYYCPSLHFRLESQERFVSVCIFLEYVWVWWCRLQKKNFFLFGWDHSYVLSSSDLKKGKVVFKLGMCECLFMSSSGRLLQHEQQQTKAFHSAFRSPVMPFQCFIKITLTFVMCINVRFCSIYSHYISPFLIFPFPLATFEFFEC